MDGRSETAGERFNQNFGKDRWGFQDCFLVITRTGCLPGNTGPGSGLCIKNERGATDVALTDFV